MAGQISARNGGGSGALSRAGERTRTTGVDCKDIICRRYLYKETVRGRAFRSQKGSRIHAVFDASHARCALVAAALGIGMRQNILTADLVVQGIACFASKVVELGTLMNEEGHK